MRSVIVFAAIASLAAGSAVAQYDAKEPAKSPTVQTEPKSQPSQTQPASPTTPDSTAALSEPQAKARFEAQGYTNVSELKKDEHGMWTAKAMKDGRAVQLSLDARGQIQQN